MTSRVILTDLTPGTNFGVQVRAVSENSVSDWSTRFEFTTDLDLVVPGNITGATWVVSGDSFHAEWDAVTNNVNGIPIPITRYEIELVANSITKTVSVPPVTDVKPVYDLSFEANRALFGSPQPTVTFKVRAVDNKGLKGAPSSVLSATNPAPATPTSLVVTPATDQITLKWTGVSDADLIGYNVYVGSTAGFTPSAANRIYNGMGTQMVYTTTTYTTQYFKIYAQDKFLQESSSPLTGSGTAVSPFGGDTVAPGVPSLTSGTITNNAHGQGATVALAWSLTSPPSDLAGYKIRYRRASSADTYIEETYSKDVTSGIINLPSSYQNYEFQIRAFDWAANYSAWSGNYTVTSPGAGTPSQVTGVQSISEPGGIRYTWNAVPEGNINYYELQVSQSSTFASGNFTFNTGKALALSVNALSPNTTYYARVRAINVIGTAGAYSATDTETTQSYDGALTSVSADIITPGTLGAAGSGVINIGAGATLRMNGGALTSNTYGGTTYNAAATSGFFIDDTHVHIPAGEISANALKAGTISGTNTITLSGPNAKIVGGGFELSGNGLLIPDGSIQASKLLIQNGQNLMPARQASWEGLSSSYSGGNGYFTLTGSPITGVNSSGGKFGPQKFGAIWGSQASNLAFIFSNSATDYNVAVEAGKTYIFSLYAYGSVGINSTLKVKWDNGTTVTLNSQTLTGVNSPAGAIRNYGTATAPAGVAACAVIWETTTQNVAAGVSVDGIQVEEKQTFSDLPSTWTPPGVTIIDGSIIRTGSIISNAVARVTNVVPVYDTNGMVSGTTETEVDDPTGRKAFTINVDGSAEFSRLSIRGNVVVGDPLVGGATTTFTQSLPSVVTTSASPTITGPVGTFVIDDIGKVITGTGIPAATSISTINADGSGATMTANATASATITASIPRTMEVSSTMSSGNYVKGSTGWTLRSDGYAEFRELAADSVHGAAIRANTLDANALTTGILSADLTLAGTVQTAATPTDLLLTYTSGSTTVTTPGTDVQFLNPDDVGLYIVGPGIPPDTKIVAVASTTSATISKVTTSAGTNVNGAIYRGRTVTMSGAYGIVLQDQYRENVVVLPTNPDEPSLFSGSVVATDLFVNDEFRMFGLNNSLGQGSALTMQGSAYNPTLGPKMAFDWPYINMSYYSGGAYSLAADPYENESQGGFWDQTTQRFFWTNWFFGGGLNRCTDTGVVDFGINIKPAMLDPANDAPFGGVAADSTHFYIMTKNLTTGVWRQQAITRANMLKAGGPVAGDLFSQQVWSQATPDRNGLAGYPQIAKYGGSTFVAKRNTLNQLCLYRYGNALTPSALNALTTGYIVSGNIQSMTVGKFDFGGNAVFAAITCSGAGSYRQVYFIKVSDDAGVLGNVFGTYTNYNFPLAFAESQVMTVYKGTTTDDNAGKFVSITYSGKIADYSNLLSTYASASLKTSMRWRNDGTNPLVGSNGGSAALGISNESNVLSYSAVKRSRFTISSQVPIPDVGGNSPNAVTFYMGVDAGTRWRYDELPKGVKSQVIPSLRTSDASGTTLPMKNGVASKILGTNLEINGDGNVGANTLTAVAQPYRRVTKTTNQLFAASTWTQVAWDSLGVNVRSVGNIAWTGGAVVPVTGNYMVSFGVVWIANASNGRRVLRINRNNQVIASTEIPIVALAAYQSMSTVVWCQAGDVINTECFHTNTTGIQADGANHATIALIS